MDRRTVVSVGLVLLLALAGCNGILDGSDQPGTSTPATTTATQAASGPHPPLDGTAVLDSHRAALEDATSFRYVQNATVHQRDPPGLLQVTNVSAAVDLGEGTVLASQTVSLQGSTTIYVDGTGDAVERRSTDEGTSYRTADGTAADPEFYATPPLDRYLDGLNFTEAGTTTVDGVTVTTYEATELSRLSPDEHGLTVIPPENVETVDSRIRIDETGLVRSFEYRVTGTNENGDPLAYQLSLSFDDVGSTAVSAPPWLSEARNATGTPT